MTNGDMFKSMFPNCEVNDHYSIIKGLANLKDGIDVKVSSGYKECFKLWFPSKWWNSEYEKETQCKEFKTYDEAHEFANSVGEDGIRGTSRYFISPSDRTNDKSSY